MKVASANDVKRINNLVPKVGVVREILDETPDVKTFRISTPEGERPFTPMPGQLGMYSMPAVGEAMFSVTSYGDDYIDMSIKKYNDGVLTSVLHAMEPGQEVGIRGPYGNGFPIEQFKGKDIVFIAGGIGLAPVRSLILYCMKNREDFGKLTIIYGGRSKEDLCFKEGWDGHVGFVPDYVKEIAPNAQIAAVCGPPILIKLTLPILSGMGYPDEDIITTLELRMKCGIGKCGRCNIGSCYVCLDGPVFSQAQLNNMPKEY